MKYIIAILILLVFSACNLLEVTVEVNQKSVLDNGNQKDKVVDETITDLKDDTTTTTIKRTI